MGKHSEPKIVVRYNGKQYDITDYVNRHPGGKHVLLNANGKEISTLMQENEHSTNAYQQLEKYRLQ